LRCEKQAQVQVEVQKTQFDSEPDPEPVFDESPVSIWRGFFYDDCGVIA
jgi:hypothetical protein